MQIIPWDTCSEEEHREEGCEKDHGKENEGKKTAAKRKVSIPVVESHCVR